jgi:FkbH-like protein
LQAPKEATRSRHVLAASGAFERVSLTKEDLRRGQMYQEQIARRDRARAAASVDEFLADLAMTARIAPVDKLALPRVFELVHKTNQFNLTTRRYSATDLQSIVTDPNQAVFYLQLSDRFGDNGIVGAAIVRRKDRCAHIDNLLLSCRVIGRTAETALLAFLVSWARDQGLTTLHGDFIPTDKNAPAADFYARHGFTEVVGNGRGSTWELDLSVSGVEHPRFIRVIERDSRYVAV